MPMKCTSCNRESGGLRSGYHESDYILIRNKHYCPHCTKYFLTDYIEPIIVTTTNSIDGFEVDQYISIESVEIVIGTGVFSEFMGDISDIFGTRSTSFETKMQNAKNIAISKLKAIAYEKYGDAIIGVDMDYTEFSSNRIGVVANGTIVKLRSIDTQNTIKSVVNNLKSKQSAINGVQSEEVDVSRIGEHSIILKEFGVSKYNVIKVIREYIGLNMTDAKDIVDNAPKIIKDKISTEFAEQLKALFEEAGATLEI